MPRYLYLRQLRHVDHTVFCVQDGRQKTFWNAQFGVQLPYSSGQQVKRSLLTALLETLQEPFAPVTTTQVLKQSGGKRALGDGEPLSAADPAWADQLIGGWMRAAKKDKGAGKRGKKNGGEEEKEPGGVLRRRSPLSISAMRPLHPLLAALSPEAISFDRSGVPGDHQVIVRDENGNSLMVQDENGKNVPGPELQAFLESGDGELKLRTFMPEGKVGPRATGLFVVDMAIDLERLFVVSSDPYDPETPPATAARLEADGWERSGYQLRCPAERRQKLAEALAHALVAWRVTSNQSRTYSPQEVLAVALSEDASLPGVALRADLADAYEEGRPRAAPVVEPVEGVALHLSPALRGHIAGLEGTSALAVQQAEQDLRRRLLEAAA